MVAILAAAAVLVVGASRNGAGAPAPGTSAGSPASRGEVIFATGHDASGAVIPRTATSTGGMMGGGGMMGVSCAGCHGNDGRGRTTQTFTSPDITYGNLTDPKGMLMPDGTRGPTYADASIRTAVTQGTDPAGARLQSPMPQWQLSDQQWADLLAYLKTLRL